MNKKNIIAISGLLALGACSQPCTEEVLQEKSVEIAEKIQKMATSGDMGKLMELTQKAQKISQSMGDGDNIEQACEAADELLAEL